MANAVESTWIEDKAASLIARIKASPYAASCFDDVRHFVAEGYVRDVALQMVANYWLTPDTYSKSGY